NRVTEALFQKYRRPEDYLAVPAEELERDIFATGFFRQKAKSLRGTMKMLLEEFDGQVPRQLEELVRLPGVARKTANVVAAELGSPQGIVVDTHVRRLSQRLRLTRQEDPVKIERDLIRLVSTGARVIAVEPGEAMLAQLRGVLPEVEAIQGAAESIPLADASVDAITVGQAFHWFRPAEAVPELRRVLRDGGSVALIWNNRDPDDA